MVRVYQPYGGEHQLTLYPCGVGYHGLAGHLHEMKRRERLLTALHGAVGSCTDYEVNSEFAPRTNLCVLGEQVAECEGRIRRLVGHCAVYALLNLVNRHGRAVVEQEVVTVNPVLGAAVLYESLIETAGFGLAQVERLGEYLGASFSILPQERVETCGTQYVIGLAKCETPYEMGGVEVKKTVVEDCLCACPFILDKNCGVAVKLIDGLARLTCQKVCVYAVCLSFSSLQE